MYIHRTTKCQHTKLGLQEQKLIVKMIIVNYYNIYHAYIPFVICQCPSPLALR